MIASYQLKMAMTINRVQITMITKILLKGIKKNFLNRKKQINFAILKN